jgi:hypothetical protein
MVSKAIGVDLLGQLIGAPGEVGRDPVALSILATYVVLGAFIYAGYGYRHSHIGRA